MTADRVVSVEHVTRRYRRGAEIVTALDDVSVELHPGELTVAAGPSGSGKTTLLSIIAGYEPADAGTVRPGRHAWCELAYVPQAPSLLDELTVAENVDLPARLSGQSADATQELLQALEIAHLAGRYPPQISGGEQQRTAIGRALRLRPPVLVGDEPTGHQDRGRVELVLGILRAHAYADHVVLISSHDDAVIAGADRVLTLADGHLVADERIRAGGDRSFSTER